MGDKNTYHVSYDIITLFLILLNVFTHVPTVPVVGVRGKRDVIDLLTTKLA